MYRTKRSRFTERQIAFALQQAEAGTPVLEVCRKMGVAEPDRSGRSISYTRRDEKNERRKCNAEACADIKENVSRRKAWKEDWEGFLQLRVARSKNDSETCRAYSREWNCNSHSR